jgi:tetratricopeptide (TPR) repeat protein
MKKIFLVSFLGITAIFSVACNGSTAENENVNVNVNINANVVEPPKTEVPVYTDAATALADGNKFFDENATEKAIEAYKQATKLDPDLAEAHFKLGIAYLSLESEQELIETPTEPANSDDKSKKQKQEKKSSSVLSFENAVTAYKKILKKNPKDDVALFNLGRVYDRLNEDKESRESFEDAVKLQPENTQYQTELGAILIKLAQYDEAVRALKKAVELDDANAQAQELLEKAEAGKKRVDDGADKLKDKVNTSQQEPEKPGKPGRKPTADKDNSNEPDTKASDTKTPDTKAPEVKRLPLKPKTPQPKNPPSSKPE